MIRNKKIYFASDLHLGLHSYDKSLKREKLFVQWLDEIKKDAKEIYLVGDVFNFWFEYRKVVPRGFTRFLGKVSEITDGGIPVHFFTGNHDIWAFDYLPEETGVILHRKPFLKEFNGLKFFIAHGDGLGPGNKNYKIIKKMYTNPLFQWLFARLHPNFAISIAHYCVRKSRYDIAEQFKGEDKEWLILFAKKKLEREYFDYFIFGHRHIPFDIKLNKKSRLINLGDWINNFSYAAFDGKDLKLKTYNKTTGNI